jgi:hypothetical protein
MLTGCSLERDCPSAVNLATLSIGPYSLTVHNVCHMVPDSTVGTATRYGLGGPGIESQLTPRLKI